LAEQLDCLAVVLATRSLPKHGAACRVGCGDSGEDRECGSDAWCGHFVGLSTDQFGDVKERPCLSQAMTCLVTIAWLDTPDRVAAHGEPPFVDDCWMSL